MKWKLCCILVAVISSIWTTTLEAQIIINSRGDFVSQVHYVRDRLPGALGDSLRRYDLVRSQILTVCGAIANGQTGISSMSDAQPIDTWCSNLRANLSGICRLHATCFDHLNRVDFYTRPMVSVMKGEAPVYAPPYLPPQVIPGSPGPMGPMGPQGPPGPPGMEGRGGGGSSILPFIIGAALAGGAVWCFLDGPCNDDDDDEEEDEEYCEDEDGNWIPDCEEEEDWMRSRLRPNTLRTVRVSRRSGVQLDAIKVVGGVLKLLGGR